jgi:hypothetical protein
MKPLGHSLYSVTASDAVGSRRTGMPISCYVKFRSISAGLTAKPAYLDGRIILGGSASWKTVPSLHQVCGTSPLPAQTAPRALEQVGSAGTQHPPIRRPPISARAGFWFVPR